jgi:S1-C subfamily serine protease
MIFSKSGGSQGIGFAIPSNLVRLYVDSALTGRKVERPWLGARIEGVTRDIAEGLGLDRVAGALISRVSDRGPAAAAGLQPGDVIVRVDGFEVADPRSVYYRLTTRGAGNTSRIEVMRKNRLVTVELDLKPAPVAGRDDVRNLSGNHPFDGARVSNVLPGIAEELGLDEGEGVVVLSVRQGAIAARLGFQACDVILQIGPTTVTSVVELERAVRERQRMWQVAVKRGDRVLKLQVPG